VLCCWDFTKRLAGHGRGVVSSFRRLRCLHISECVTHSQGRAREWWDSSPAISPLMHGFVLSVEGNHLGNRQTGSALSLPLPPPFLPHISCRHRILTAGSMGGNPSPPPPPPSGCHDSCLRSVASLPIQQSSCKCSESVTNSAIRTSSVEGRRERERCLSLLASAACPSQIGKCSV
jgi:hypothetical protein